MGSRCSQAFSRVSYQIPQNHHQVHKQTAARHAKDAAAVLQEHDAERNPRAARAPLHNQQPQHNRDRERTERIGCTREGEADRRTEESIVFSVPANLVSSDKTTARFQTKQPKKRAHARAQSCEHRTQLGRKQNPTRKEREENAAHLKNTRRTAHHTNNNNTDAHGWFDQSRASKSARWSKGVLEGKGKKAGLKAPVATNVRRARGRRGLEPRPAPCLSEAVPKRRLSKKKEGRERKRRLGEER
jgi:hypothetical protein